jgi:hypothetical protein
VSALQLAAHGHREHGGFGADRADSRARCEAGWLDHVFEAMMPMKKILAANGSVDAAPRPEVGENEFLATTRTFAHLRVTEPK